MSEVLRNVCFTAKKGELKNLVGRDDISYIVIGEEVGAGGYEHHQGFVQFASNKRWNSIKEILGESVHIEKMMGTARQASDYCKKEGKFFEWGELREQGGRSDLNNLKLRVRNGENSMDICNDCDNFQQIRFVEKLCEYRKDKPKFRDVCVYWLWGKTGVGKTHRAFEMGGSDVYCKQRRTKQWWEKYNGQKTVILDDIRRDTFHFDDLITLIDKYPVVVEVKGGSRDLMATKIIITCPWRPEVLFDGIDEDIEQLTRRITKIEEIVMRSG